MNTGGHNLCVDCYYKLTVASTLQFQQHAAMMNLALDEMDALVPVGGRYRVAVPKIPDGPISNNVVVTGGTVGAINTGTVQSILVTMKGLAGAGHHEVASALQTLTQAVIQSQSLNDSGKNEALEQIEYLAEQASAAPEARKTGTLKAVVTGLGALLAGAADVTTIWEQAGPVIKGALGL